MVNVIVYIPLGKSDIWINIFPYFSTKNMLWYSLEAPPRGASNEYHNKFSLSNKKNINTIYSHYLENQGTRTVGLR